MPSVVSMPPNISTAAFEATSSCVRPPPAAAVATSEVSGSPAMLGSSAARSAAAASRPLSLIGSPAASAVTAATMPSYQPRIVAVSMPCRPSACATMRAASGPASSRRSSPSPRGSSPASSAPTSSSTTWVKRSRTAARRNGCANGSRWRSCCSASSVSMLGPTTRPVEKRGSSTVSAPGSRIAAIARSRRVTSQAPSAGSQETGSRSRSRASSGCGSASSSCSVAAAPMGNESAATAAS